MILQQNPTFLNILSFACGIPAMSLGLLRFDGDPLKKVITRVNTNFIMLIMQKYVCDYEMYAVKFTILLIML